MFGAGWPASRGQVANRRFLSVLALNLLGLAIGAQAEVVELYFFHLEPRVGVQVRFQVVVDLDVKHLPALAAQEVGVGLQVAVVVHVALVDAQGPHGVVLLQQLQGVVHGGARQRGYLGQQVAVYGVDGGVGEMLHQVVHDGYPLHRGTYAVVDEMLYCRFHFFKI